MIYIFESGGNMGNSDFGRLIKLEAGWIMINLTYSDGQNILQLIQGNGNLDKESNIKMFFKIFTENILNS